MKLRDAAAVFGISPNYLAKVVRDALRPAKKRKRVYPAATHETYLSRHFVKDMKGRPEGTRGRLEWEIDDRLVFEWKRRRERRLHGNTANRDLSEIRQKLAQYI
jgi:hypothetical protein